MTKEPESEETDETAEAPDVWDASEVLRARSAETRRARDESIQKLRDVMSDEEIFEQFGIDLTRLD